MQKVPMADPVAVDEESNVLLRPSLPRTYSECVALIVVTTNAHQRKDLVKVRAVTTSRNLIWSLNTHWI